MDLHYDLNKLCFKFGLNFSREEINIVLGKGKRYKEEYLFIYGISI